MFSGFSLLYFFKRWKSVKKKCVVCVCNGEEREHWATVLSFFSFFSVFVAFFFFFFLLFFSVAWFVRVCVDAFVRSFVISATFFLLKHKLEIKNNNKRLFSSLDKLQSRNWLWSPVLTSFVISWPTLYSVPLCLKKSEMDFSHPSSVNALARWFIHSPFQWGGTR